MSVRTRAAVLVTAALASSVLVGCDREEPPPPPEREDHAVERVVEPAPAGTPTAVAPRAEEGKVGKKDAAMNRATGDKGQAEKAAMDTEVAQNAGVLGALRDESQLPGVGGLIGAKGTQTGASGLGARGAGSGGGGWAEGLGGLGTRGKGYGASGYGGGGGAFGVGYGAAAPADRVPVVHGAPMTGDQYDAIIDNDFQVVADAPLSTLSIDVDTASYANVRRYLNEGRLPPRDAVRIEELLNYFDYDYAGPDDGDAPFATHVEVTECPWRPGHQLARIGIQGREVARDATPPRNLVFLVDVSGSMSGPDRLPLVKRGLRMLADQLGPRDRVAMVVYAGAAGVVLEPTPGDRRATIREAVERLSAGGSTAGAQGIRAAYDLARQHYDPAAINRVILATDGDFNVGVSSEAELVQLIEEERESGVFLTVLGFGRGNLQDAKMEQLADKGNGHFAYIDGYDELRKVLVREVGSTLVTIAKDVKIQVEFNPARVGSYRLIGYENRVLASRDFNDDQKDAGEIGAGHAVTALYEIVPAGAAATPEVDPLRYQAPRAPTPAAGSAELMTVKIRYKRPDGDTSRLLSWAVGGEAVPFARASVDTRWAAGVAGFGMLLRESPHKGDLGWGWVLATAREAMGADAGGYRHQFVSLVESARSMARE